MHTVLLACLQLVSGLEAPAACGTNNASACRSTCSGHVLHLLIGASTQSPAFSFRDLLRSALSQMPCRSPRRRWSAVSRTSRYRMHCGAEGAGNVDAFYPLPERVDPSP